MAVALVNEGPQASLVTGALAGAEIAVTGIPVLKARLLGMGG